ncbi:kinesin-like protein KIF19 isoform X1 [Camelus bactrianus]|uniref:Kinesin-like protein KIF19 isoform X1 n=1 Tax=Camelus bactrianus TaxID=9837 RepID=A0AC58NV27_CAMBA
MGGALSSPGLAHVAERPWSPALTWTPRVALRIRPLSDLELEDGATVVAHKAGDQVVVLMDPGEDPEDPLCTHRSREKTFIFDTVFDQQASQEDVYRATTQHLVEGVVSGYSSTMFAYGPSGAGKTHTMLGTDAEPGIYLQTLTHLLRAIEETRDSADCSVSTSYLEIYNEAIRDLLNPSSGFLDLREDARGSIQIAGITEVSTSNAQEIMQLLTKGNRQRTQEPTATNQTSSRSHAVLQVTVRQRSRATNLAGAVRLGRLFMVDLAGSERASQTQNRGVRMKEGAHINRSLLALGNCINALSEKGGSRAQYMNFRDSKLTRLLKDALGGNSRTVMIAHVSPASTHFEELRCTLLYAYRAKNIKTRVKRNLLKVSYHITQYTDVISDLRREIERLQCKVEKQEEQGRSEPGVQDAPATIPPPDAEEDSRLQMNKVRAQLIGAFKEQLEMRRSLLELENTNVELHIDTSRHLLTIADWERERTYHLVCRARTPGRDQEPVEANADGGEGESAEPHEVALAREEVSMLLAEQRRTAALKAGLEQRLANAKKKVSQMEKLLPAQVISEDQGEVLRLLCRAHELEVENTELQASSLCRKNLLCQKDFVIQRYHQHWLLCEQIIQDQRQLLQDGGIAVPERLEQRLRLYSRELGAGTLNRLLLLHTVMSCSLRDGSVLNTSPPSEEPSQDQPDDRKDLPWGAQFKLPPMLLETDSDGYKSSKVTPSRKLGKQDSLLPPPSLRILLTPPIREKSSSRRVSSLVSKLCSPVGLEPGTPTPRPEAQARLSTQALKEMAASTKSIALIAATRRSWVQDREGGRGCSSLHPPEEVALDSRDPKPCVTPEASPTQKRWPHASPGRGRSMERKARRMWSPSRTWSRQPVMEKLQPPSTEHMAESQLPSALLPPSKSSGKSIFPAVPAASKIKPSLSVHAEITDQTSPECGRARLTSSTFSDNVKSQIAHKTPKSGFFYKRKVWRQTAPSSPPSDPDSAPLSPPGAISDWAHSASPQ